MFQNVGNVLIAIILIFAPSAGMFLLGVTNDSKTLMVLTLAWLVVSVTGSFVVKVWRKLEDPAVDKVAAEISRRAGEIYNPWPAALFLEETDSAEGRAPKAENCKGRPCACPTLGDRYAKTLFSEENLCHETN